MSISEESITIRFPKGMKDAFEELCYAEIGGKRVRVNTLAGVLREALMIGLTVMLEREEKKEVAK